MVGEDEWEINLLYVVLRHPASPDKVTRLSGCETVHFIVFSFLIYLFLAALGLHCCTWAFSSCGEWGQLFGAVCGLLIALASLVVARGL